MPGFRPELTAAAKNLPKAACSGDANAESLSPSPAGRFLEPLFSSLLEEPTAGDGTVPLWSSAPAGIPVRYVSSEHGSIFTDADAQRLLRALLRPDWPGVGPFAADPAQAAGPVGLSAQALRPSVEAGGAVTVAVVASRPVDAVEAVLEVRRFFPDGRATRAELPLRYRGGPVRSLALEIEAPNEAALLQFVVRDAAQAASLEVRPVGDDTEVATVIVLDAAVGSAAA